MPVDKNEWDAGRKWETLEARILKFLRDNRDKAFNDMEILSGVGYRTSTENIWTIIVGWARISTVQSALKALVKEGTVKAKIINEAIGETTYYMARERRTPHSGVA